MEKSNEIVDDKKKSHLKACQKCSQLKIECDGDADAKNFVACSNCILRTRVYDK